MCYAWSSSLDTSPLQPELSANRNTNAYEPGSMTASPTLPQSIDTHVAEDSKSSGSMDKSACENCSAGDTRIKKLEDENRELHIRCQVSVKVLPKLKIAHVIGKAVWDQRGDIRDVISIGKLVRKNDGPEEVEQILSTMTKYGNERALN